MNVDKPFGDMRDVLGLVILENNDYIDRINDYNKIYSNIFDDGKYRKGKIFHHRHAIQSS